MLFSPRSFPPARPSLCRTVLTVLAAFTVLAANPARSQQPTPAAADAGGQNVALVDLGATAKGSGGAFNKDWPPNGALHPGQGRGGTLVSPLKGSRVDIRLMVPADITALEVIGLDYHGTLQAKAIDIFIDGKMVQHADLPETPAKPFRIPLAADGQEVGILVTDEYPVRTLPGGTQGPNYGGWERLRVISTTDIAGMLKPVDNFDVPVLPINIAPTGGSQTTGVPEVAGQPRTTAGHPCTLWDQEDIAHYKEMLGTSKELQDQLAGLRKSLDARLTEPTGVPQPRQGLDGKDLHLSDMEKFGTKTIGGIHNQLSLDIANLGTLYVLTGEAKYAEYAKKLLLAYADAYPHYGVGARPGFAHSPSKVFDQTLGDAIWLVPVARGYDLIHDLPSITPEERRHIEDDFLKADARQIISNHSMLEAYTNWSAIGTCAVLTTGYATDDAVLIKIGTYGIKGTPEKPTGGFYRHFSAKAIDEDGLWVEGAMGYQFMALQALIMDAETLWHHGVDLYRYRDCALKRLFDSPIAFCYPDLTTPALHDSHHGTIIGADSFLYEYAYRRYHDPAYVAILNQIGSHLDAHFQQFPVSVLYDRDRAEKTTAAEWKNVNFFGVGYGFLRLTTDAGTSNLILEYGPAGSHGHPDKLTLDLYAFNAQLIIDPGSVWYEQPLYRRWYRTTLAHPTLIVDELDQNMCGAHQAVYAPADGMGMQRAWTKDAYPGVTMDRALFLTPEYVADVFGAFARRPRKLDLAWHIRGQFASDLKLEPMAFPEPVEPGYNELANVRHVRTDQPWTAAITREGNTARFVAAGGTPTDVIVGDGHYGLETPPTILERRTEGSTVYGNAVDLSGAREGYVRSVTQAGGLEAGYGLLKVQTARGTDLCFAAYHAGSHQADDLETDALQAFVLRDGPNVRGLYLGGGRTLKVPGASLARSESGLASLERADTGGYLLANPSAGDTTVTVTLAALDGMDAFNLDPAGRRAGAASVRREAGGMAVDLKASSRVEFAPKSAASVFDYRQAMLGKRQAAQEAARAQARKEYEARAQARQTAAAAKPAPANTVLVVAAPAFSAQGGGTVTFSDNKRAAVGRTVNHWDDEGHWLEWTVDAPADGYYNLTLCYCSEADKVEREIQVNGEVQEPFAPMTLPSTGGFSNGSDDWRLFTAADPGSGQPLGLKLKRGKNVIRLTNLNGRSLNVNYLAVTSPDVTVTRELLAAKLQP